MLQVLIIQWAFHHTRTFSPVMFIIHATLSLKRLTNKRLLVAFFVDGCDSTARLLAPPESKESEILPDSKVSDFF